MDAVVDVVGHLFTPPLMGRGRVGPGWHGLLGRIVRAKQYVIGIVIFFVPEIVQGVIGVKGGRE